MLSMMAIRAGAGYAICCEMNPAMCAIAEQSIQANGYADHISVLCMHSSQLTPALLREHIPKHLLQEAAGSEEELGKVDLIVTELMDSGLFGEHMIATLRRAQSELLKSEGLIIPHSAVIVGQLIESHEIYQRKRFDPTSNRNDHQPLANMYRRGGLKFAVDESYTCEPLRDLPHTALCE